MPENNTDIVNAAEGKLPVSEGSNSIQEPRYRSRNPLQAPSLGSSKDSEPSGTREQRTQDDDTYDPLHDNQA